MMGADRVREPDSITSYIPRPSVWSAESHMDSSIPLNHALWFL